MAKLKLILAGFFLLISVPTYAADTPVDTPGDKKPAKGFKCVFVADGPLLTINSRLPAIAKMAGFSGHSQVVLKYESDAKKIKAKIIEALSGSKVDLLGLSFSRKLMGTAAQFAEIMDSALATNPKMQFMILAPSPPNIPVRKEERFKSSKIFRAYKHNGARFHKSIFTVLVEPLRVRYPSNRIFCAYYGQAAILMRIQFDEKKLPEIPSLVGQNGVFLNNAGKPGPMLTDLNAMFSASLIYNIDWAGVKLDLGYRSDMVANTKKVLLVENRHRPTALEPFTGDRPNIFIKETWDPDWGYTVPVKPRKGYNCLFFGHRFFIPLVESIEPIAKTGGVTGHKAVIVTASFHQGTPGVGIGYITGEDNKIRAALDTGKIDLLGLTFYEVETGQYKHYKQWFDYALAKNPKTRFLIHMPSSFDPVHRDLKILNRTNDAFRKRFYVKVIRPLQIAYPKNEIIFWYSGSVSSELRRRFEAGKLSPVKALVGPKGIFAVSGGIPGPLLKDLEGLILYSLIYKVDLPKKMTGQKGKLDLNALAAEMMAKEAAKGM
jgi:hypothetical protein